jgi:hypothetical protein
MARGRDVARGNMHSRRSRTRRRAIGRRASGSARASFGTEQAAPRELRGIQRPKVTTKTKTPQLEDEDADWDVVPESEDKSVTVSAQSAKIIDAFLRDEYLHGVDINRIHNPYPGPRCIQCRFQVQ